MITSTAIMRLIFAFGSLMASLVLAAPGPVAEINRRINCRDICLQQYNDCRNIALLDDQTCVDNVYQVSTKQFDTSTLPLFQRS